MGMLCIFLSFGILLTTTGCKTDKGKENILITFDSLGGSEVAPQTIKRGEKVVQPERPVKENSVFVDWYMESTFENQYHFEEFIPEDDLTLYAKWNNLYTVSFDTKGAGSIPNQIVEEGNLIEKPTDPKKTNASFGGWYKEEACQNEWDFKEALYKNITLYAKWTVKWFRVTFDSNGGTEVNNQLVEANGKANRPTSPTKDGYIFTGWYKEPELENAFDFVNTPISSDITLYAKWTDSSTEANRFKVIFNSKGGSDIPDLDGVLGGSTIARPADPVREGYTFVGWFKDTDGELVEAFDFVTETIKESITLYAKWDVKKYTIQFESNGGTEVDSLEVAHGLKAIRPKSPTQAGFIFIGWYKDEGLKEEFDFINTVITSDITLYAKWEAKPVETDKVKVIFNSKGGSSVDSYENITIGSKIPKPSDPVREGYTFLGWFKDTEGTLKEKFDFNQDVITESITLYAKWDVKKYTIQFESNGGTIVPSQEVPAGAFAIRPTTPTREGYLFVGWYRDAGFDNEFDFINTKIEENMYLYAKWIKQSTEVNTFIVIFNSKGGTDVPALENVASGSKISKPADPVREGYTFLGWFKDENGDLTEKFNFDQDVITEDTTLYAKWTVATYIVTFDTQAGSKVDNQKVTANGTAVKPADPIKANHTFLGWFKDKDGTTPWNFETDLITSNTTIYACWEKNQTEEDLEIKFPFSEFNSKAPKDSAGKTTADFEIGQFKVSTGAKSEAAMLNSQGKDIYFTVTGKFSNSVKIVGTGGSTTSNTVVTLYQVIDGKEVLIKELGTAVPKGSFSALVEGLEAGVYRLKTQNSLKITVFTLYEYNQVVEIAVHFNTANGSNIQDVILAKWQTVTEPEAPVKDGYIFKGWYIDSTCQTPFDFNTKLEQDITLYAKWEEKPIDPSLKIYTVTYETNGGTVIPSKDVNEGFKVAAPNDPVKEGYFFIDWYDDPECTVVHDFTKPIMNNITIYAKWEEKPVYVTFENTNMDPLELKKGSKLPNLDTPTKPNFIFAGWYKDNTYLTEFDFNLPIEKDTILYAKWEKDPEASDYIEAGPGQIVDRGAVELIRAVGQVEGAYITFRPYTGANGYTITLRNSNNSTPKVLDDKYVYIRSMENGVLRADILGIPAGSYEAIVYPKDDETAKGSSCTFVVGEYDRSGYAHFNYTAGVGAYDDTGALKENAIVLWVTDQNKNTISLTHKGTTVVGIGNILNSVGADVGGGLTAKGGKANTNQGILRLLAEDNIPLVIRFVGCVSDSGLYKQASFAASSTPLINGLTVFNSLDWGGTPKDNGHMARMKSGKDITIEGVGEDATIDGWGFHFMAESSGPELGKSFEVRNLKFINTPEDAIGMEGVQEGSTLTASVERCWIHNNEFYCPSISGPAESDKAEGDGSCDFKRGQYLTCSYNYFEGCHKTNLVGASDSNIQYNLTYHHNYWKLCKARGPLSRTANIHMYNNVFEGQTDFAMNTRANAYIFSEYNLFYMVKSPHRVDSGAIKSYNDSFSSCINEMGGTIVKDKNQKVPTSNTYSDFDTNATLSYIPNGDYVLQTNITEARKAIYAFTGVRKAQNISMKDVEMKYISVLPSSVTPVRVDTYPTTLNPGKISKTVYAFTLSKSAEVSVSYGTAEGVLVNEAGECMLTGGGTVILKAGTYICQSQNFQPGVSNTVTPGTFKDMTINSITIQEHDDGAEQIADYDAKAKKIPAAIEYNSTCYQAIVAAKTAYSLLSAENKAKVTVPYSTVTTAWQKYITLGKEKVTSLIQQIGTVTESSGSAIMAARTAYNQLIKEDATVQIENYQTLLNAESAFKSYAITSCINKINAIVTPVTIEQKDAILAARAEYDALGAAEKAQITNLQKLLDAEKELNALLVVENVVQLIANVDLNSTQSMKEVLAAYDALSAAEKAKVSNADQISNIRVSLVMKMIQSIGTVTIDSKTLIDEAEAMYATLNSEEKAKVTNYDVLTAAKAKYDELLNTRIECTFAGAPSDPSVSVSGNYGKTSATIGGTSYAQGLKMESSTSVTFQTDIARTLTLHVTAGKKIKVDGKSYTVDSTGILVIQLSAGSHTLSKDTTGTLLYALFLQ